MKEKLRGRVWRFRSNVDTDQIIPAEYLITGDRKELARHAFEKVREEFAKQVAEISPVDAIATLGREENPILIKARKLLQTKGCCDACVVPAGAVKVMQVVASLALPRDVSLSIIKE